MVISIKEAASPLIQSRALTFGLRRFPLVVGALAIGALGYHIYKKRQRAVAPCTGGMSITPDPKEIPVGRKFGDQTRDVVEEASWQSFPASDPPAY